MITKKIKKVNKIPKKLIYENEQYQIENWGQCDLCKLWRIVKRPLTKNEHF